MRRYGAGTREWSRAKFSKNLKQTITYPRPRFFYSAPLLLALTEHLQPSSFHFQCHKNHSIESMELGWNWNRGWVRFQEHS